MDSSSSTTRTVFEPDEKTIWEDVDEPLDLESLTGVLLRMYWGAAEREICNMILAFREFKKHEKNDEDSESVMEEEDPEVLDTRNFERFMKLWAPMYFDGKHKHDLERIINEAKSMARARFNVPKERRWARYLLQASSFLDLDLIHEYVEPLLQSLEREPQVEALSSPNTVDTIYRPIQCSVCETLIRAEFYHECAEGCMDSKSLDHNTEYVDAEGRIVQTEAIRMDAESPVRVCSSCLSNYGGYSPCLRTHLIKVWYYADKTAGAKHMQKELNKLGEKPRADELPWFVRTFGRHFPGTGSPTPGNLHVGLMFGPLIIENGLPKTNRGVLLSTRPVPRLLSTMAKALIYRPDDIAGTEIKPEAYALCEGEGNPKTRLLRKTRRYTENRQFLAVVKRVFGGLFSGHNPAMKEQEEAVINALLSACKEFHYNGVKKTSSNHNRIHKAAANVLEVLKGAIEGEVKVHLSRITKRLLDPKMKLSWDYSTNHCQNFCDNLLKTDFDGLFHKIPYSIAQPNYAKEQQNYPWPRYLYSFGSQLNTSLIGLQKPPNRSAVYKFYHRRLDNADLIDYAESLYRRGDAPCKSWADLLFLGEENVTSDAGSTETTSKLAPSEHVWELPRDTVSIIHTHLFRFPAQYSSSSGFVLTSSEWAANRLQAMRRLDLFATLAGAMGYVWISEVFEAPDWPPFANYTFLPSYTFGCAHKSEKRRQLSLPGFKVYWIAGRERSWVMRNMRKKLWRVRESVAGKREVDRFEGSSLGY
ncbi:hypothetical protein RUND412_002791 [Rhizina undulata]